jgi:hypothetical protein
LQFEELDEDQEEGDFEDEDDDEDDDLSEDRDEEDESEEDVCIFTHSPFTQLLLNKIRTKTRNQSKRPLSASRVRR